MTDDDDNLVVALRALPRTDVSAEHAERLRRQAQTVFQESAPSLLSPANGHWCGTACSNPGSWRSSSWSMPAGRAERRVAPAEPASKPSARPTSAPRPPVRLAALEAPPAPK